MCINYNSLYRNSCAQLALQLSLNPCTMMAYLSSGLHPVIRSERESFLDVDTYGALFLWMKRHYYPYEDKLVKQTDPAELSQ